MSKHDDIDGSYLEDEHGNETSDATEEELAEWKRLLVLTHVHRAKASALASVISKELRARAKHFAKVQEALVESIRYKSHTPLVVTFGSKLEAVLADIKPLDKFNQAVDSWWDDVKAEMGDEE